MGVGIFHATILNHLATAAGTFFVRYAFGIVCAMAHPSHSSATTVARLHQVPHLVFDHLWIHIEVKPRFFSATFQGEL